MQGDNGKLAYIEDAAKRIQDTVSVLRDRTVKVEEGLRARAAGVGGTEATNPDLAAVQALIRSGIAYIQENPVPATLLALGAGVVATSLWNRK